MWSVVATFTLATPAVSVTVNGTGSGFVSGPRLAVCSSYPYFEKGQPLYIIEVMKMFNTVRAPFSGTVDRVMMTGADGTVVQKGQPIFKITPDEKFVEVDPREVDRQRRARTSEHLKAVLMSPYHKRYEPFEREGDLEEGLARMFIAAL